MLLQVSKSDNPLPLADVSPRRFSNLDDQDTCACILSWKKMLHKYLQWHFDMESRAILQDMPSYFIVFLA